MSLVVPPVGMRIMKRSFRASDEAKDARGNSMAQDPLAVRARNDLVSARSELRNGLMQVFLEDAQELAIQVVYKVFTGVLKVESVLADFFFLFNTLTTLAHMVRQLNEAWWLRGDLPRLERKAARAEARIEMAAASAKPAPKGLAALLTPAPPEPEPRPAASLDPGLS